MRRSIFIGLISIVVIAPGLFAAPVDIQLDRSLEKFNLGVSAFLPDDKKTQVQLLDTLYSVVTNDLRFSKYFNLLEKGPIVNKKSQALEWAVLGSDVVLSVRIRTKSESSLEISARLYDTHSGKEVLEITKKGPATDVRILGHAISDDVVKYFTGQSGIFSSKLVFVNDVTGRKELYSADYDGKGLKRLTNDNSIVILPRISPNGQKIIFTSYISGNPDLYIMNRDGSGRKKMSAKAGLNVSPSWSPNNSEIALTLSMGGQPNIYLVDLSGQIKQQLTDSRGADTAPSFSPDGTQISFTSDRAGNPQIYVVNIDGSGLRRLTTAPHCDSSAWSPDGQTLVYVKGEGRAKFDIYSIEVMTGIERRLTWGEGDSENPSWSPDGRFILFVSNRRGKYELFMMDADGSDQKVLPVNNGQSYTPHWGN